MENQNRKIGAKCLTATMAVLVLLLQFSCKDKEEGCMDIAAVNWDASADKACDDCCTYPSLTISLEQNWNDSLLLRFDTTYLNEDSTPFQITSVRFYLSDFKLISGEDEFLPTDSLEVELYTTDSNVEEVIDDNFALISKFTSTASIGSFQQTDLIADSVGFSFGLNSEANTVDPTSVEVGHPLAIDSDSMFQSRDSGYIFAKIGIVTDTFTMDTTIYRIVGSTNNVNNKELRFERVEELIRGTNVVIPIEIRYSEWFKGINFATDSDESIKTKFVNNLANVFIIDE